MNTQTIDIDMIIENRTVPTRIVMPGAPGTYPLIAFSSGANLSPDQYDALLLPIAAAGHVIIAPTPVDAESMDHVDEPPIDLIWETRNTDIAAATSPSSEVVARLDAYGILADPSRVATMGHSFGALIAQLPAGALAYEADGKHFDRRDQRVKGVIAWSPPAPIPQSHFIKPSSWATMTSPSLTITGTADELPGFIDDWELHKASYENAPVGQRWLWIGDGVDHYFGGLFGRINTASTTSVALLGGAIATSIAFLDYIFGEPAVRVPSTRIAGETLIGDRPWA